MGGCGTTTPKCLGKSAIKWIFNFPRAGEAKMGEFTPSPKIDHMHMYDRGCRGHIEKGKMRLKGQDSFERKS
jgi:hypothetical protein